jgi:kynurenine formamidase
VAERELAELVAALGSLTRYDLAQPLENGMPQSPSHVRFHMALSRRHGDNVREGGGSAASEVIVTGGHVGTHIDALSHVSQGGALHGGRNAAETQTGGRMKDLGADTIEPLVARGVLLDVARVREVDVLPGGYAITTEDLEAALEQARTDLRPGDVVLVRTGWARNWGDAVAFVGHESGVPGVSLQAARWLREKEPIATGADTIAYETIPPGQGHAFLPVHRELLVESGIYIIETLRLEELSTSRIGEFLFIAAPLLLVGATGSPIRPIALA